MFDFGFWELAIIGIITIIVVGPEKMPALARKAGVYAGKLKKFLAKVKADIDNELEMEELKKLKALKEDLTLKDKDSGIGDVFKDTRKTIDDR